MKKLYLPLLIIVFTFLLVPHQASAWKRSYDCDGNGVYDFYDSGHFWSSPPTFAEACGYAHSSATFGREIAPPAPSFDESIISLREDLNTLVPSITSGISQCCVEMTGMP